MPDFQSSASKFQKNVEALEAELRKREKEAPDIVVFDCLQSLCHVAAWRVVYACRP